MRRFRYNLTRVPVDELEEVMLNQVMKDKPKIRQRDIQLVTCPRDDNKMMVHGVLKNHRSVGVFDMSRTYKEP